MNGLCNGEHLRLGARADGSAPKERRREVPYVQPSLQAVLQDALQWDSFRDFLALGIPGGFMMQLEGNSYDVTTLLAGLLGGHESGSQCSEGCCAPAMKGPALVKST